MLPKKPDSRPHAPHRQLCQVPLLTLGSSLALKGENRLLGHCLQPTNRSNLSSHTGRKEDDSHINGNWGCGGTIQGRVWQPNPPSIFVCLYVYVCVFCVCFCIHTSAHVYTEDICPYSFETGSCHGARLMASNPHRSLVSAPHLAPELQALVCGYTWFFILIFKNVMCTGVLPPRTSVDHTVFSARGGQ